VQWTNVIDQAKHLPARLHGQRVASQRRQALAAHAVEDAVRGIALHDLCEADVAPRRQTGPPRPPVATGPYKGARIARMKERQPLVQTKHERCRAPRCTRSSSPRLSSLSRGLLRALASHNRILTRRRRVIHPMPPRDLTRRAAAGPCLQSCGGSTRGAGPPRAVYAAPVRSSQPNVAARAGTGPPCARPGSTVTTSAVARCASGR
jgi:hypothetical protein